MGIPRAKYVAPALWAFLGCLCVGLGLSPWAKKIVEPFPLQYLKRGKKKNNDENGDVVVPIPDRGGSRPGTSEVPDRECPVCGLNCPCPCCQLADSHTGANPAADDRGNMSSFDLASADIGQLGHREGCEGVGAGSQNVSPTESRPGRRAPFQTTGM